MNITINKEKLEALLTKSFSETLNGYWEEESYSIGGNDEVQIHIVATKNKDAFMDNRATFNCLTIGDEE
ncbi:hypothetical protein [Methylotenera sp.]|uniref:hypothetical protein n=1 Tax=Methylotenera sp. TaxID=2051956 RepID=UPI00248A5D04|nr:hypothetical protein [Methylotenera sp.]MDI1360628.1 hypothetical protein [Methylotenera sp.]